ncbi:hypothetical protein LXL04_033547 [Taraxacum kok-saghyz]
MLMQLLREISHDNVVKLVNVHINHIDMSLYLAFDYAEHDLYEIIRHHRDKVNQAINQYTVKSILWQLLNGLNYLHKVMGDGEEQGIVKIADFGLARIYQAPLKPLFDNGVVVTIWYRAPELLLGGKHYTSAVDMWAVGCIFAELLTLKPLFQGQEVKATPNPFQACSTTGSVDIALGLHILESFPNMVENVQVSMGTKTRGNAFVALSHCGFRIQVAVNNKVLSWTPTTASSTATSFSDGFSMPDNIRSAVVSLSINTAVVDHVGIGLSAAARAPSILAAFLRTLLPPTP